MNFRKGFLVIFYAYGKLKYNLEIILFNKIMNDMDY